jgi:hypothetical protein
LPNAAWHHVDRASIIGQVAKPPGRSTR